MNIQIDPEFQQCIPPLTESARQQLEQMILAEGCRDALVVWRGDPVRCEVCGKILEFVVEESKQTYVTDEYDSSHYETDVSLRETVGFWCDECGEEIESGRPWTLLDGHHRYEICLTHEKWYPVTQAPEWVETRDDALLWILRNQEGRRNLDEDALSFIRGKRYELEKRREGRPEKLPQNEDVSGPGRTSDRLAEEYGVSHATIERDAEFSQAVDTITEHKDPHFRERIMRGNRPEKWTPSGEREMTKAEIIEIGEALETHQELRELPTLDQVLYTNRALQRETPSGQQEILADVQHRTEVIKEQHQRMQQEAHKRRQQALEQPMPHEEHLRETVNKLFWAQRPVETDGEDQRCESLIKQLYANSVLIGDIRRTFAYRSWAIADTTQLVERIELMIALLQDMLEDLRGELDRGLHIIEGEHNG